MICIDDGGWMPIWVNPDHVVSVVPQQRWDLDDKPTEFKGSEVSLSDGRTLRFDLPPAHILALME